MWFKKKVPLDYPSPAEWKKLNEALVNRNALIIEKEGKILAEILKKHIINAMLTGEGLLVPPRKYNRVKWSLSNFWNAEEFAHFIIKRDLEKKGYTVSFSPTGTIFWDVVDNPSPPVVE